VIILFEFQNSDIDEEDSGWRLNWVAGIALLRTIGHVLAKCDAETSEEHAKVINAAWDRWKRDAPENSIFWNFIETERNSLLKTYTFGATLAPADAGFSVVYSNGEDAFQLYREAVYWWRHQLNSIENALP